MSRRVTVVLAVLLAMTGCQRAAPTAPPVSSAPTPGATGSWGPLAVAREDADAINAALGGEGPLRIGDSCVTLLREETGDEITLVWRDGQTTWDPDGSIIFEDGLTNRTLVLEDGARIGVGGAGSTSSPLVAEPDPSCPDDSFVVHTVDVLE